MDINTRDLGFLNFNGQEMNFVKYNGVTVYEAWKKLLASGIPPLILPKTKQDNLISYTISGESKQHNKNLIPFPYVPAKNLSMWGMQFITNDDGSITLNGTATANYNAFMLFNNTNPVRFEAGTYTLSGNPITNGVRLWFREVGSSSNMISVYNGSTATITLTKPANMYCYLAVNAGAKVDNVTLYPQIEKGSVATEWVSQVVTPDTPIEIKSVGDKTINLINPNAVDGTNRYIVAATGYPYAPSSGNWRCSGYIEVEGGKEYNFNAINSNATTAGMAWYDSTQTYISGVNTTTINNNNGVLTAPDNAKYARVSWKIDEGYNPDWQNTVQVSEGSECKPFEPYGKYKIPVKARGKNIYNPAIDTRFDLQEDGSYLSNTYITQQTYLMTNLKGVYSISVQISSPVDTNYRIRVFYTDGTYTDNYKASTGDYVQFQFKTTGKDIARIVWYYGSNSNQVRFKDFQIESGDTATDYEPYKEPTYSTIYLDKPLRKIGDYVDYIDFNQGKVFRQIHNEYVDTVTAVSGNFYSYWVFLSDITKKPLVTNEGNTTTSKGWCLSNKFQLSREYYQNLSKNPNLIQPYVTTGGINRVAYTFDDASIDTVSEAQEKIGEGFEISYVLETPTEESIELPNIPIHKGTTIIEVDTTVQPSNMEVIYLGKK